MAVFEHLNSQGNTGAQYLAPGYQNFVTHPCGIVAIPTLEEVDAKRQRWEKALAKAGNARVRRGLIQLAWRFLRFQKDSALTQWFRVRTDGPSGSRKTNDRSTRPQAAHRVAAHGFFMVGIQQRIPPSTRWRRMCCVRWWAPLGSSQISGAG